MTTRRDNPHSGRLADGWDKFCRAKRLKVGDFVEFTRLEAHELSFDGVRHGKDAIAKVFAYKERKRRRSEKRGWEKQDGSCPFLACDKSCQFRHQGISLRTCKAFQKS